MAKDKYHDQVHRALEKDDWTITAMQKVATLNNLQLFVYDPKKETIVTWI